jgi:hypothetical protein
MGSRGPMLTPPHTPPAGPQSTLASTTFSFDLSARSAFQPAERRPRTDPYSCLLPSRPSDQHKSLVISQHLHQTTFLVSEPTSLSSPHKPPSSWPAATETSTLNFRLHYNMLVSIYTCIL